MATNCHEAFSRFQLPVNIVALLLCYAGAANYGLAGAVSGLLIGQSILMLGVVILILNRIGWQRNSSYLLKVSVWGFVLLPACLYLSAAFDLFFTPHDVVELVFDRQLRQVTAKIVEDGVL